MVPSPLHHRLVPTVFRNYRAGDRAACLDLFDRNCPAFFAPNERLDYEVFLAAAPDWYELCVVADAIIGAFGLDPAHAALRWIMIHPDAQGRGVGSAIMTHVMNSAARNGMSSFSIAASQKSAPFFAKFGAISQSIHEDGWGPGMDRIDMTLPVNAR